MEQVAELNKADNEGNTLLTLAARNVYIKVVKYLVEHKAALDKADNEGNTALTLAASNG